VKLTHPEHHPVASGVVDSDLLVACLGPNANDGSSATQYGGGRSMYGRDHGRTLRHVYAASPTTGVLCVWVLDTNNLQLRSNDKTNADSAGVECDASVRLKLKPGEVLTVLTPMSGSSLDGAIGTAWLLAATSLGRLWKIYKTSRPLTLHAKLVKKNLITENGPSSMEEEEEAGIVRGLYNYFTTPSKYTSHNEDNHVMDAGGDDVGISDDEDENIVALALVPMLLPVLNNERGAEVTSPPLKVRRISAPPSDSCARALSLSSSLVVKEWKVSLFAGSESEDVRTNSTADTKEGYISRNELFPRYNDGTLNLECLRSKSNNAAHMEDDLVGYRNVDILTPPSLGMDGRSLLVVVRIEKEDAESTRVYVLRIGLAPLPGEEDGVDQRQRCSPYILDAAWLDRFSGQSLSSVGGTLECAGLVTAEEVEEENVALAGGVGGVVAYVGFGPGDDGFSGGGQPPSVTISAVHFPSVKASMDGGSLPRVKDLDLYSNVIPSVVKNSMSYDSLTGGCVFLATSGLLGGASVRFPFAPLASDVNMPRGEEATVGLLDESLIQNETVLTIKSHLQSAFRQYLNKLKEGGGSSNNPARAVIPPSIGTCTSQVLSAAVVLASNDFVCAAAGGGSMTVSSSSPFSPKSATSAVTVLRDKLQMHKDFVNFLAHAGAYRRVSTAGRIRLRDHGEMITAARALLIECQGYFSNADAAAAAAGDDTRLSELAQARQMVTGALDGSSDNVITLSHSWARLQQQLSEDNDFSPLEKDLILLTSSSICHGIGQALRYRQNESVSLYDTPSYDASSLSSHSSPWTSSQEMLEVLFTQLQAIQQAGESILSTSLDFETDKANLRQYVEDISASALSGHRDVVLRKPDDEEAMKLYEETKLLSIPLLRQYANDDCDDLVALQSSLAHSFFEGIVQICHDHRNSWRFQGPFSDQEADERYDLRPMLSNTSSASPYAHLHQSRDYRSGLPFCGYVLRWYADRGFYPEVFELGKNCPHDLTRYVRNDDRLSDLAWIQHLRVGGHEQATVGLLSLTSPVLFGDKQEGAMGLWEQDQMMSLAKLSNKLASAKSANPAVDGQRNALIENSLTLISAQRILQEDTEFGDEIALKDNDLLRLASEKINSARDVDEIKRFGICGLAIASAKPPAQSEAMANDASSIWHTVIQADIHTWKSIANEDSMAVGGMSEEELIQRVEGTAFVGVMYDFVTTSPTGEKMQNVGFLNDLVRNQVMHSLGSDELAQVLTLSAEIVLAAT